MHSLVSHDIHDVSSIYTNPHYWSEWTCLLHLYLKILYSSPGLVPKEVKWGSLSSFHCNMPLNIDAKIPEKKKRLWKTVLELICQSYVEKQNEKWRNGEMEKSESGSKKLFHHHSINCSLVEHLLQINMFIWNKIVIKSTL